MIITITGALGSGKSTVAKLIAKKLNLNHYSTGDFMREIATKRNLTILGLNQQAETDKTIDKELDDRQINLGKTEDNFIIDARIGWFFIPHSIKIFLDVTDNEAARRIFEANRNEKKYNTSINETLENIKKRKESEVKRFKEFYNIDYYTKSNYDLVIDTTKISPEQVVEKILNFIKQQK
ncbi:AAA family ATPase [Candidatus Woesearchaeota archaeon]|jgi:CMP/dCMP kinase|nr:AAA family ATPase [Candidatus Woesearchaeota archaeon]